MLLTKREACAILRTSTRNFDKLMKNPDFLSPIRITPGRVLFDQDEIEELIARRRAESKSAAGDQPA
jgi:predicted DNA-binding transcriptional regulator AlpA